LKISFQDLEKILKLRKYALSIGKVWKFKMEKKFEVSEKYSILLKARHFIIYAVLCNVQN